MSKQKGKGGKRRRGWHRNYRSGRRYDRLLRGVERAFGRAEGGASTVASDEVSLLRERLSAVENERLTDDDLERIIGGAKDWIAGRRWSWHIVATNFVREGRYHPGVPQRRAV